LLVPAESWLADVVRSYPSLNVCKITPAGSERLPYCPAVAAAVGNLEISQMLVATKDEAGCFAGGASDAVAHVLAPWCSLAAFLMI
jgi:hypothetical protein